MTELERINQADEFYARYLQKKSAITQNRENQEYLKTYIHDDAYVIENFHMKDKLNKSIKQNVIIGLVVFLVFVFVNLIAAIVLAVVVMVGTTVFSSSYHKKKLEEAKQEQVEINQGIKEQIELLQQREPQIIEEKENFAKGMEERVTFISRNEMKYLPELRKMIENGEAETCEDAVGALEQKLLFEQFNHIMENTEIEKTYTAAENKERFGDPLELIKKKKEKEKEKKKSGIGGLFGKKK